MPRLLFLLPLALFLGLCVYFVAGLGRDPAAMPSMLIDRPAPVFSLSGPPGFENGLSNADLAGEVTLINVFASWCAPCAEEHPMLMRLSKDGVRIVGVNWKEREAAAGAAFLARLGNPYTLVGADPDGRVAVDFGVTGAPETFVIDRAGRVRFKHIGPITEEAWRVKLAPIVARLEGE
jgi:cytochrome c biogenesis protein CcmG/thiol:disulfide interchange protein DsbE